MARFRTILTTKENLESVDIVPGQMLFCKDTGAIFVDIPEEDSARIQASGRSSRKYNIELPLEDWIPTNGEFIQRPSYSPEIFDGKMYDENINVMVGCENISIPDQINARAVEISGEYIMEFYTSILPLEDVSMFIIVIP